MRFLMMPAFACLAFAGLAGPALAATPAATPAPAPGTPLPAAPAARAPRAMLPQAPGGGPGEVWVNAGNKVYHCPSDRYYGRTKHGSYMTEAAAKAAGDRASGGKACS